MRDLKGKMGIHLNWDLPVIFAGKMD